MLHGDDHLDRRSARRTAYEHVDRVGAAHPGGELRVSKIYDWGAPVGLTPRFERFDHGRRVWVQVSNSEARALNRLAPAQLELLLKTHWRGLRMVDDFDVDQACGAGLDAKLERALQHGVLEIGHRSYPVSVSPTGNIRVRSGGTVTAYTRSALLDVLQRGHF